MPPEEFQRALEEALSAAFGMPVEDVRKTFGKAQRVWKALIAEEPDAVELEPIIIAIVSELAEVLDQQLLMEQPMVIIHAALRAARRVHPLLTDRGLHDAVRKAIMGLYD